MKMTESELQKIKNSFYCGEQVEYFDDSIKKWMPANNPSWNRDFYRIKPVFKKEDSKNEDKKRFMLLAENSDRPPKYVHSTASSALYEAKRLANNLECEITILEIVGSVKVVPKEVTEIIYTTESDYNDSFNKLLENENELPF